MLENEVRPGSNDEKGAVMTKVRKRDKNLDGTYAFYNEHGFVVNEGSLETFKELNSFIQSESDIVALAKRLRQRLVRTYKRHSTSKMVSITIYDPANPEKMTHLPIEWGKRKGEDSLILEYVDHDGKKYPFYLKFLRRSEFAEDASLTHKHEIERRLLKVLVDHFKEENNGPQH